MSIIGKNIKKIRAVKKISQSDFADLFNLSRGSVGSYEEGRAEPKIDTIIRIANYFSLSIDLLLTKELTVNELYRFDIFKEEFHHKAAEKIIIEDKDQNKEDTPLVTRESYLEYIVSFQNKDYINRLPYVKLPNTQHEKSRAFEVQDDAMEFNSKGLLIGDILSCSLLTKEDYARLPLGEVYVIITDKGIYTRRLSHHKPKLLFEADNPNYDALEISETELLELWKVEGFYSTILKPPSRMEERMAILEKKVAVLEKIIQKSQVAS